MSKHSKRLIKILKIIWIPLLLIVAFMLGLYIGYGIIARSTDATASGIFSRDTWKMFLDQVRSLQ